MPELPEVEALRRALDDPVRAFPIERVRPLVQKYKDVGVRVEDSFLLTETGVENLSGSVPRTIAEIERFLSTPSTARR